MYKNNFSRSKFGGKPSFHRGGRPSQGRGRGGSRGGSRPSFMDISKFVNKAIAEEIEIYTPKNLFKDFAVDERLKNNIITKGYITPTPIQDQTILHVLENKDVVGIANTGTGKTAAFLIPLIDKVLKNPKESVLIVAPTRELALQIDKELKSFTSGLKLFSVVCVGGANIGRQMSELRYKNEFVIGTPGRLKDLIERGKLDLAGFKSIVLDEADRMLDMGFINDMRYMMAKMPKERHTLFFSATMSNEITGLIHDFLNDPVYVSVKTRDTSKTIDQDVVRVKPGDNKFDVLHKLLTQEDFNKVLIFGKTKHGVEKLSNVLADRGIKAQSIHGDKNQSHRQKALKLFQENQAQVLVATDVAARGLDIKGVSHVINYDLPATYEDYIHRIGRTGRGGAKGKALTFID